MSDKQVFYGFGCALAVVWIAFYIGGTLLPEGWFGRWYTLPFILTSAVACMCAWVGGCILGDDEE